MSEKKELQALKDSIVHWEKLLTTDTPICPDAENCPCCIYSNNKNNREKITLDSFTTHSCDYCLIKKYTQLESCDGTPYYKAADAWEEWECRKTKQCLNNFYEAAKKEIIFLKEILQTKE